MDESNPEAKASPWGGRALIAGAVVLLVVNAFPSFLSNAGNAADDAGSLGYWPYLSARLLGAAVAMVLIVGVVIAGVRVAGRARTLASKAKVAVWTLVALLVLNYSSFSRHALSPGTTISRIAVTDAERQGLTVTADSITHALFGFTLPIAGANVTRSPEFERRVMASFGEHRDQMMVWVFRDTVQRQVLMLQVTKLARVNESRLREFAAGMRNALSKATPVDTTFAWRDSLGVFEMHGVQPTGLHFAVRCLARMGRLGVVCVQTMAAESSALEASRAGLALH